MKIPLQYLSACLLLITACSKSSDPGYTAFSKIRFGFTHTVHGNQLMLDTLAYRTATADDYKITDLQYFISDVILYHNGGKQLLLSADHGIHYVDARIPSTLQWRPADAVLPGTYDSLGFTFGINQAKNISGRFPNPPERDMAWPEILGGGYHYMKMNLVYRSPSATETKPFNFHLGIGQIYSSALPYPDSITGYIQNCFPVMLTGKIVVSPGSVTPVNCIMLVDKWFDGAESFNFESYPGGIMQYQAGMNKACINGRHAFMGSVND